MAWTIEFADEAVKDLSKIGHVNAKRVVSFLRNRIAGLDDPRQLGKSLKGSELSSFWRFRIGDYRIICEIRDSKLVVLVVGIGHRKKVYR